MERVSRLHNFPSKSFPSLTEKQHQARLDFAQANIDRDWSKVIFSDEKIFRHQKLDSIYQPTQRDQLSAVIWGCISADGPGPMSFISGRLNSSSYIDLLEEMLLPIAKKHYPDQQMVFMQDNCCVHTAGKVKEWFGNHMEIELLMNWPVRSPDLNLIEAVWKEMECSFTRENVGQNVVESWEKMRGKPQFFENLYASMPRRLSEVIANRGGPTNY